MKDKNSSKPTDEEIMEELLLDLPIGTQWVKVEDEDNSKNDK